MLSIPFDNNVLCDENLLRDAFNYTVIPVDRIIIPAAGLSIYLLRAAIMVKRQGCRSICDN